MPDTRGTHLMSASWPHATIFDFDGLLVDTERCWRLAYASAAARRGRRLREEVASTLGGASIRDAATRLDLAANEVRAELYEAFEQSSFEPMPGVTTLISLLQGRARLGVATNAPQDLVESVLSRLGLLEHFEAVLSGEAVRAEKPAPDVYVAACRAVGVEPDDAVAFEDSPIGITAARRAGLVAVYVPSDDQPSLEADLRAGRIDDPAVLALLGLSTAQVHSTDGQQLAISELHRVWETIVQDGHLSAAGASDVLALAGSLRHAVVLWRRTQRATPMRCLVAENESAPDV